nr:glycosyltransferase family 9 protein [Rubritalea marina]
MAENIFASLKHTLKLKTTEKSHGLVDLDFEYRKSSMRVAIHPTSSDIAKNWSPHKYLQLAEKLEHIGMQPHFVLSPTEQKFWKEVCDCRFPTPDLSIPELAKFLYESGYFIGSDSGPGHLASMLGVPTLTIFPRKRSNYQWRPGFAKNVIAAPASRLSLGKARYHRRSLLSADRVMQYFMHLAEEEYSINTAPIPAIKLLGTKKPDLSVS